MGGPNPGIIGNIKITAVSGEDVTFLIPRYCVCVYTTIGITSRLYSSE